MNLSLRYIDRYNIANMKMSVYAAQNHAFSENN